MTSPPLSSSELYLHEDEWGMISLEPDDNRFERAKVVDEARKFGEANLAPDGVGWTAINVVPPPPIAFESRGVTYAQLCEVLGPAWQRYGSMVSGYSSHREALPDAYAFALAPEVGKLYGSAKDGIVTSLNITRRSPALADTLHRLGTTFRLILCDLWQDVVIEVANRDAVARYCDDDTDDDE